MAFGIQLHLMEMRGPSDFDSAFAAATQAGIDAWARDRNDSAANVHVVNESPM
jgi:hypothetical protein